MGEFRRRAKRLMNKRQGNQADRPSSEEWKMHSGQRIWRAGGSPLQFHPKGVSHSGAKRLLSTFNPLKEEIFGHLALQDNWLS